MSTQNVWEGDGREMAKEFQAVLRQDERVGNTLKAESNILMSSP